MMAGAVLGRILQERKKEGERKKKKEGQEQGGCCCMLPQLCGGVCRRGVYFYHKAVQHMQKKGHDGDEELLHIKESKGRVIRKILLS
jgi:succinate dehydrogenase/fumarate reductase-like Fe-S protein